MPGNSFEKAVVYVNKMFTATIVVDFKSFVQFFANMEASFDLGLEGFDEETDLLMSEIPLEAAHNTGRFSTKIFLNNFS